MKVLWIVLGILGGLCLICGGTGYFLFSKGRAVFDDAGKFGDESFRTIATGWDLQEFEKRAAPELAELNGTKPLPALINTYKDKLGPMKTFTSHVPSANTDNGVLTATWIADAEFEKGPGSVSMHLIQRKDKWEILGFTIQSSLLNGVPPGGEETPPKTDETKNDEPNVPAGTGGK